MARYCQKCSARIDKVSSGNLREEVVFICRCGHREIKTTLQLKDEEEKRHKFKALFKARIVGKAKTKIGEYRTREIYF